MSRPRPALAGLRFGRLTVLADLDLTPGPEPSRVLAVCDCGTTKTYRSCYLQKGETKSCGCLTREAVTTHGLSLTPTHIVWKSMRARCNNSKHKDYPLYGGRGIKVCERWSSFENFLADMGERPEGRSIDRINSDGDYEPRNCRWATPLEQSINRRSTIAIAINGETKCLKHWCDEMGLNYNMAQWWIRVRKLTPIQALQRVGAIL